MGVDMDETITTIVSDSGSGSGGQKVVVVVETI